MRATLLIALAISWTPCFGQNISRGPYLQRATTDGMTIRWRTDAPTRTAVWLDGAQAHLSALTTTEHEVQLTGLVAGSSYSYSVGDESGPISGTDSFRTLPPPNSPEQLEIWVLGDSGSGTVTAAQVRDAYLNRYGQPDVWLMLGDNAYELGRDSEFQTGLFDVYPETLRQVPLWLSFGNHDGASADAATQTGPYFDIFTLPKDGESGGIPSNTEAYYSFDYGAVHFVALDSAESDLSPTGSMATWLRRDLAARRSAWTIVYFHHPPYSKGKHDSDTNSIMIEVRENLVPIMEEGGVDLVMAGHSHNYERSYLTTGHHGSSGTYDLSMRMDAGSGQEPNAYVKPSRHEDMNAAGTVFMVAGTSGGRDAGFGSLDHPAMFTSMNDHGSVHIAVDDLVMRVSFLDKFGAILDSFAIDKTPVLTTITSPDSTELSLSQGGSMRVNLDAGPQNAGRGYLLAASGGTRPGFRVGNIWLPLNWDGWIEASIRAANSSVMVNTLGVLDSQGRAQATIVLPAGSPPRFEGLRWFLGFAVHDASGLHQSSDTLEMGFIK